MYKKQGYLNEKFKLFHLSDISDTEYSFHYHDFYKIIVFLKGKVTYSIEGMNYDLNSGDIVLVGKSNIHCPFIDSNEEYERFILYLSQNFLEEDDRLKYCFQKAQSEHNYVTKLDPVHYTAVLDLLYKAEQDHLSNKYFDDIYEKLKVYEAILKINESVYENGLIFNGNVRYNQKIIDICEYINQHINENLSIDFLSQKLFLSKFYFQRLFKEQTGISVHQYIIEKRVLYAKHLQDSGYSIKESALYAGFNDYSTYLRALKNLKLKNIKTVK